LIDFVIDKKDRQEQHLGPLAMGYSDDLGRL